LSLLLRFRLKELHCNGVDISNNDSRPNSGDEIELHLGWAPEDKQAQIVFKASGTILRVEVLPGEGYGFAVEFADIPVLEGETDHPFA